MMLTKNCYKLACRNMSLHEANFGVSTLVIKGLSRIDVNQRQIDHQYLLN